MTGYQVKHNQALVEALRSGKYTQGHGALRSPDNKLCCLGIACVVYQHYTGAGTWRQFNLDSEFDFVLDQKFNAKYPVTPIVQWFGWPSENPIIDSEGIYKAVYYNDELRLDFKKIADFFEATFVTPYLPQITDYTDLSLELKEPEPVSQ